MNVIINSTQVKVISSLTLNQIKEAKKFVPQALVVKEDNNMLYKVELVDGPAALKPFGVAFNAQQQGNAAVAFNVSLSASDDLQDVAESFMNDNAVSLAALAKFEGMVAAQIETELTPIIGAMNAVVIEE